VPYAGRVRLAFAAIGAALLSACIHVPPKPISPETTAQQLESRSLEDPGLQKFVGDRPKWDLDSLTLAAFYFHPDLDVARAEAAVARAAIITGGERPNPTLTLPVEHKAEAGFSPWIVVLGLDIPIETANKRGARVHHAEDVARAAELTIAQDAWQLRSAIRTQLVALSTANESADAIKQQRDIQNDLVEALEKRFELGEGSRFELTQARIAARNTELLLQDRQGQIAQARAQLAAAVGVPQQGIDGATFHFDAHSFPYPANVAAMREQALRARPDILVALANYAATESDLRLELAKQYPDIHIAPGFGWDQGSRRWDLGFSATLPIFSRNRGPIAEAEARRSAQATRFVALQAHVIASTEVATAQYDSALKRMNAATSMLQLQRSQTDAVRRSFNAGEADRVALRTSELELVLAQLALVDSAVQAQQALGALEDAIEQPLTLSPVPQAPIVSPREGSR
jgi:outer membrane protein, heavy metal efflux system